MTILHAFILGIVEGITEFLPISSTAHLILTSEILRLEQTEFLKSFEIAIQLGAILSVVAMYWKTFVQKPAVILRLLAAFVPTVIVGFLFHDAVRALFESTQVILWALLVGGLLLIVFEYTHREKETAVEDLASITYIQAVGIGLFQAMAIVPGVSRAAATIIGGLLLGLRRRTIVDFSFLLAVPTMGAATVLDLSKTGASFSSSEYVLLAVGFVTSFVVAWLSILWLLRFIKTHTFVPFGIYRILLAAVLFVVLL